MAGDRRDRPYRRIGDTAKCPACGWRMDADAYRCPKCFIYFCFKCRARVTEREPQFQCADQSCTCYGKLLCAACTVMVPEFADVTRTVYDRVPGEPEHTVSAGDNWGFAALIVPVVVSVMACWFFESLGGLWCSLPIFIAMSILLASAGSTWFKHDKVIPATTKRVPREITENKQVAEHRCCIGCKHPIKVIR